MELEEIRRKWIDERPAYQAFVDYLKGLLEARLKEVGLWRRVSGRAKEIDSLVKKIISKKKSYDQLTDKAGVRVVVRFHDEISLVAEIIHEAFDVNKTEDKTKLLGTDKLGYQGTHFDVQLKLSDKGSQEFGGKIAEIQVRSLSQDLWSEMAHELNYKTGLEVPSSLERRLFCLNALVEVADMEFTRIYHDIGRLPGAEANRILRALERQFFKLAAVDYDKELSLALIRRLAPLYSTSELENPEIHFEEFFLAVDSKLLFLFERYSNTVNRPVFLSQPEILMILDLLEKDQFALVETWSESLPTDELERVALFWGKSLSLDS
jgi:ppGpp synthetase/RelA/SpoT-type nucleotidyltranferase